MAIAATHSHPNTSTRTIEITARLYACRDAARLLLGESYRQRMSELGVALTSAANAAACDVLHAAIDAARSTDGIEGLQILAAAVELIEPSGMPACQGTPLQPAKRITRTPR